LEGGITRSPITERGVIVIEFAITHRWRWPMCAAHDLNEKMRDTKTQRWHANADYANLDFDDGPHAGLKEVPYLKL